MTGVTSGAVWPRHSGGAAGPAVALEAVSKQFGATRALNGVSIGFMRGEIHCLLGENGAGKSTIGKIIGGVYAPDSGRLRVNGKSVRLRGIAAGRALGIAVVFQELSLAPDLSVRENICLGTEPHRHPWGLLRHRGEEQRCRTLLHELDLHVDLSARICDLPVANQQMIEITKALALHPDVLILDEPTAMLGAAEKARLFAILQRLKREGTAVVFITHHIDEVVEIGDRVSIMKDGTLIDSFPMSDSVDADFIVEKLAGRRIPRTGIAQRGGDAADLLRIQNLPGRDGSAAEICVRRGEIAGLYGVVGCGRERIARAVAGLEMLREARLLLDGVDYKPRTPAAASRHGVAYLPAGRASNCILPTRSIGENLMLTQLGEFQRAGIVKRSAERGAVMEQLARLRARFNSQDDLITSLSGGNQQKVLLGRCLGHAKRLLVLEDPTAGIDVAAKQEIHELIREKARGGLAVVVVSSDLAETLLLCDVVYTIFDGRVFGTYRPPSPADEPAIIADVLGTADGGSLPSIPLANPTVIPQRGDHATR